MSGKFTISKPQVSLSSAHPTLEFGRIPTSAYPQRRPLFTWPCTILRLNNSIYVIPDSKANIQTKIENSQVPEIQQAKDDSCSRGLSGPLQPDTGGGTVLEEGMAAHAPLQ